MKFVLKLIHDTAVYFLESKKSGLVACTPTSPGCDGTAAARGIIIRRGFAVRQAMLAGHISFLFCHTDLRQKSGFLPSRQKAMFKAR